MDETKKESVPPKLLAIGALAFFGLVGGGVATSISGQASGDGGQGCAGEADQEAMFAEDQSEDGDLSTRSSSATLARSDSNVHCETRTYTDVRDNAWQEIVWQNPRTGHFRVSLNQAAASFGVWGKGGKFKMQIRVGGNWEWIPGHPTSHNEP